MNDDQKNETAKLIQSSLDQAEAIWDEVGKELTYVAESATFDSVLVKRAEVVPSQIPGHSLVSDQKPEVDTFVAMVADMRDSSKHLMEAISPKSADVSQLQRVFYETSALLPAMAQAVKFNDGKVTEYLGDGLLALFRVTEENPTSAFYGAYNSGRDVIGDVRGLLNAELRKRYRLPDLDIGVGLSLSKAVVTLVGLPGEKHPKAIGECIYRASKISKGRNEMHVDQFAKARWPTAKNGVVKFSGLKLMNGVDAYLVGRSS